MVSGSENSNSLILKLRALWLLEKLSANDQIGKKGSPLVKKVFETVAELLATGGGATLDFVENYQLLRTVHKYTKLVDLKSSYSDRYQELIKVFMERAASLIH